MDDLISRQAVTDEIDEWIKAFRENGHKESAADVCLVQDEIMQLPSIQPEQKTGHWVEIGDEPYDEWECDNCGFVIDGSGCIDPYDYRDIYKYCPNCGAQMK